MYKKKLIDLPTGRFFKTVPKIARAAALALLCTLPVTDALAQCFKCPAEASATASASSFAIFVNRGGTFVNVSGATVGACETLILTTTVAYQPDGGRNPAGAQQVGAAYAGGRGRILLPNGSFADVTPADLATTIVGPTANGVVNGVPFSACAAPAGFTITPSKQMNNLNYTVTAADIALGSANFRFDYDRGTAMLPNSLNQCNLTNVTAGQPQSVSIAPLPTCSIQPPSQTICVGGSATFTATATGIGPFTYCWQKGCPGAGPCLSTSATLTINNAQVSDAGCYELTVTDQFGCTTTCQANLIVSPNPTCTISGDASSPCPPNGGVTTHVYTSTVNPPGGTVTHSWSISGDACATITGPTTGPSVTVSVNHAACPAGGSFTLRDDITRDTCPGSCTLTVPIGPCRPDIEVLKEVACDLPGDACGTFAKVATGVKNSACPAFCYRVRITNVGPVPITSLTVTDPVLGSGDLSGFFGPLPIAPGDSRTHVFTGITHCQDTPDTVTVNGRSSDGQSDTDTDDALARVLNINIVCESALFSSMDMDGNPNDCNLLLPETFSGTVQYTLTLRNSGNAALDVTSINGLPALVDCETGAPIVVALPIHLAGGGSFTIQGCLNVACNTNIGINVTAHAEASDENGTLCVHDSNGVRIADDTSPNDCVCNIACERAVTCRVTGGGVLLPDTFDQSCIRVDTTILPFRLPNGLTVNKITHGGQLGAPFSEMDCGEILGNPCIRGQWQHTRHYEGKANPRDVIDMNFHSTNPKGVFDSLNCACLGCCDPETGVFITPITLGGICNPDDHKICGPQPRPAPANAIIWSGIGRITPEDDVSGPRAARSEWVIYRVYIEDRSEPGGFHPKGAVEPADIYCFQAWKTGIKVSKKPDFSTVSTAFRRALGQANCDFLNALQSGALPIGTLPSPTVNGVTADIQDCGPMHDGNHQIHPATSATCE